MKRTLLKDQAELYDSNQNFLGNSVKRKTKPSFLKVTTILAFFGVFIFSFLFYTWVHTQVVHISYEIAQARTMETEYLEINKRLKTEIATLKTPSRIKQLARANLGLNVPKKDQVIIIK